MENIIFCTECGNKNSKIDLFCTSCGSKLNQEKPDQKLPKREIDKYIIEEAVTEVLEVNQYSSDVEKMINVKKSKSANKKSKLKIIILGTVILMIILGIGAYFITRVRQNNVAIETFISLDSNDSLSKYKSSEPEIDYKLPISTEFEFISSSENLDENMTMYVNYKTSDESIATVTEDGFFEGQKEGTVELQVLNRSKILNTMTIEVLEEEITQQDTNDQSYEEEIQEFLQIYKRDYIKSVNEGDYDIVKKYLVTSGPLDKDYSVSIKDLYTKGITKKLKSLQFLYVDKVSNDEYIVNVKETMAITENEYEQIQELDTFYNIIKQANGEYLISEMQIRSVEDI